VVLRFDDGQTCGVEIGSEYDLVGSIFVIGRQLENSSAVEEFRDVEQKGWSIQSHTMTHPDLTTLSDMELHYELGISKLKLMELGFNPTVFAYPHSRFNDRVIEHISQYYEFATAGKYLGNRNQSRYLIPTHTVRNTSSVEDVMEGVYDAINRKTCVTIMFHRFAYEGDENVGRYWWYYERYEELCKRLAELRDQGLVKVLTAEDAYMKCYR